MHKNKQGFSLKESQTFPKLNKNFCMKYSVKLFCFRNSLHFQSIWTTFLNNLKKGSALNVKLKVIIDVFILVPSSSLGWLNLWTFKIRRIMFETRKL